MQKFLIQEWTIHGLNKLSKCLTNTWSGQRRSLEMHTSQPFLPGGWQRERERERESEFAQLCPTLCDPMGCRSLLCSSVHRILQARVLEWVAISFSRGSPWPRDWTRVSRIVGTRFTVWATRGIPGGYHAKRNLQSDCGSLDFFGFESSFMSSVYF